MNNLISKTDAYPEEKRFNEYLKFKPESVKRYEIKPPSKLQIIFGQRNQAESKYYLTTDKSDKSVEYDALSKYLHTSEDREPIVKAILKERIKEKKEKYVGFHTFKSFLTSDIRKRIRVDDLSFDMKTIIDLDPDFYSIIEGRPIKDRFCLRNYVDEFIDSAVSNLQTGYVKDEILKYEGIVFKERTLYKDASESFNRTVNNFETFLCEDYNRAKEKLEESNRISKCLAEKNEQYKEYNIEHGIVIRKIYVLEEKCRLVKMYQEFLFQISPFNWQKNEGNNKLELYEKIQKTLSKYQIETVGDNVPTLTDLISIFKSAFQNGNEPRLYFTEPWQLRKILNLIETQNLTNWLNSEKLIEILENITKNMSDLKSFITKEFNEMQESIDSLTNAIEQEELHESKLKESITKIINFDLKNTISSEETLKCNVCIRDVYEKLIFKNLSFDSFEMIKTLEIEYEDNMRKLDNMNKKSVKITQELCYSEDMKIMKMAQNAAKELKNLEKLYGHLKNSFV